jgi:hypothetical protein
LDVKGLTGPATRRARILVVNEIRFMFISFNVWHHISVELLSGAPIPPYAVLIRTIPTWIRMVARNINQE